jgi:hypothetical protein
MFRRDLRQQQPSSQPLLDDEPVPPDHDLRQVVHRLGRGQHREVDREALELMRCDGLEAVVVVRDVPGQADDGSGQRLTAIERAQAPAEIVAMVDGHEDARRGPVQIGRSVGRGGPPHSRDERAPREVQQAPAFPRVNHRHTAAAM